MVVFFLKKVKKSDIKGISLIIYIKEGRNEKMLIKLAAKLARTKLIDKLFRIYEEIEEKKEIAKIKAGKRDLNKRDYDGWTPLMNAIIVGKDNIARLMVEKGADVNLGSESWTPLMVAIIGRGNTSIAEFLLDKGADIEFKTENGRTALECAVACDDVKAILFLIEKGADINNCRIPLDTVSQTVVELLVDKGFDINAQNVFGRTLLMETQNTERAIFLIERGADVNMRDRNGSTALMRFAYRGDEKVIQRLIEKKADVNASDNYGTTPLMYAITAGKEKVVQIFVENGADVNAKDMNDRTVLMKAIKQGLEKSVKLLIEKGADVNASELIEGKTALMMAIERKSLVMVEYLINAGADINKKDDYGRTALDYARKDGINVSIVRALKMALRKQAEKDVVVSHQSLPIASRVNKGHVRAD